MSPDSGLIPGRGTVFQELSFQTGRNAAGVSVPNRRREGGEAAPHRFSLPAPPPPPPALVDAAHWPNPLGAGLSEAQDRTESIWPKAIDSPLGVSRLRAATLALNAPCHSGFLLRVPTLPQLL